MPFSTASNATPSSTATGFPLGVWALGNSMPAGGVGIEQLNDEPCIFTSSNTSLVITNAEHTWRTMPYDEGSSDHLSIQASTQLNEHCAGVAANIGTTTIVSTFCLDTDDTLSGNLIYLYPESSLSNFALAARSNGILSMAANSDEGLWYAELDYTQNPTLLLDQKIFETDGKVQSTAAGKIGIIEYGVSSSIEIIPSAEVKIEHKIQPHRLPTTGYTPIASYIRESGDPSILACNDGLASPVLLQYTWKEGQYLNYRALLPGDPICAPDLTASLSQKGNLMIANVHSLGNAVAYAGVLSPDNFSSEWGIQWQLRGSTPLTLVPGHCDDSTCSIAFHDPSGSPRPGESGVHIFSQSSSPDIPEDCPNAEVAKALEANPAPAFLPAARTISAHPSDIPHSTQKMEIQSRQPTTYQEYCDIPTDKETIAPTKPASAPLTAMFSRRETAPATQPPPTLPATQRPTTSPTTQPPTHQPTTGEPTKPPMSATEITVMVSAIVLALAAITYVSRKSCIETRNEGNEQGEAPWEGWKASCWGGRGEASANNTNPQQVQNYSR